MNVVPEMLQTHPRGVEMNAAQYTACIEACYACDQACTACADACLGETNVQSLVRCIRLNQDCADICATTGRMLLRQSEMPGALLRQQLELCAAACRACAAECEQHAHHHEHCRICAEACHACEQACQALIRALA
jgi:hypothetical protein